jgi:HSP20 family protein
MKIKTHKTEPHEVTTTLESRPTRALTPFEEMDRLFEHFMSRRFPRLFDLSWPEWPELGGFFERGVPRADVVDRDTEILVRAELPGMKKEDLEITLTEDTLTLAAKAASEVEEEQGQYHRREIRRGEFSRTIMLPAEVDGTKATATFTDGVLEITMPKIKETKRVKVEVR